MYIYFSACVIVLILLIDDDNVLVLSYEQMKKDPYTAVSTVSSFLGYKLTDEIIQIIVEQTTFDKMKTNPAANFSWSDEYRSAGSVPFMRKGVIGDWKNHFSAEQSAKIDELVSQYFSGTDLKFDFGD